MEELDVNRIMEVLSEILSDKYDCKITIRAVPKASTDGEKVSA